MRHYLLYCHGFQSSPQSLKAIQTRQYFAQHYPQVRVSTPQLPCYPAQAAQLLHDLVKPYGEQGYQLSFIGSSLGGYLVTHLAQTYRGRAVVINPAVRPYELLEEYQIPLVQPYTQEMFQLNAGHMEDLRALDVPEPSPPQHFWALLQTEDETLDYRQAEEKYRRCKLTIEPGGDHSFQGYERHLPAIADFLLAESISSVESEPELA